MNIYEKMMKATTMLQTVAKNLVVETGGKNNYKAVSERDIIDAVKPVEAELGIYSYPFDREIIDRDRFDKVSTYNGQPKTTTQFYLMMKTTYRFVNTEDPKEFIDIVSYSTGLDSGDKAEGKAMTYADKYALMKAYKISTGDDPDKDASEDASYKSTPITSANVTALMQKCTEKRVSTDTIMQTYGVKALGDLTMSQWIDAMRRLEVTK